MCEHPSFRVYCAVIPSHTRSDQIQRGLDNRSVSVNIDYVKGYEKFDDLDISGRHGAFEEIGLRSFRNAQFRQSCLITPVLASASNTSSRMYSAVGVRTLVCE